MVLRRSLLPVCLVAACASVAFGQASPPPPAGIGAAVQKEVKNLSADDFPEREAALKRLQALVADQLKQRAAIQDVLMALQVDLAKQQAALAVVTEEEAQAQIAGLLEMERGLAGWTIQVMSEPIDRRKKLLDWGLSKENVPVLARVYAQSKRARLEGIKQLAKMSDDTGGMNWTLSKLINDRDPAVRAGAMAAVWNRKPAQEIVDALWFRAVAGPLAHEGPDMRVMMVDGDMGGGTLHVDFPGGEPLEFDTEDEAATFVDAALATDVLVHVNSDLVGEKVKGLVADRIKAGRNLAVQYDPEFTLITHRLVEVYRVKEAIPVLAAEALGAESETMGGEMNGRPFMWSRRTIAIGTLATLIGKEPSDFEIMRARNMGDSRSWMWATDVDQQAMMNGTMNDRTPMMAFYAFWKDHYKDYGIKEKPIDANIPPAAGRGGRRGRGLGAAPVPIEPGPGGAPDGKLPLNPNGPEVQVPAGAAE